MLIFSVLSWFVGLNVKKIYCDEQTPTQQGGRCEQYDCWELMGVGRRWVLGGDPNEVYNMFNQ